MGYVAFDYPENTTGLDFEEIVVGLSLGDVGLTFALGQDGAPDYTEVSYSQVLLVSHMVNMMIMEIILQFHMDSHAAIMIVVLHILILKMVAMVQMKMH